MNTSKTMRIEINGHTIILPEGVLYTKTSNSLKLNTNNGICKLYFKEFFIELYVTGSLAKTNTFSWSNDDKTIIELNDGNLDVNFLNTVNVIANDRKPLVTSKLTCHLIELRPGEQGFKDGKIFYTIAEQSNQKNKKHSKKHIRNGNSKKRGYAFA